MQSRRASGFTLIELMIVIAIVAIGLALAWPSFEATFRSNRVATGTNTVIAAFNLARTEAIRNNDGAGICPSANGTSCGGVDWNVGWLVWADEDASGLFENDETVLRYYEANADLQLTSAEDRFVFDGRGRLSEPNVGAELVLAPTDCPAGLELERLIEVTAIGQVHYEQQACQP